MNTQKKIELLEELVTILYRMKDDSGLGYPPSKFVKDSNRIEEIESELAELDKEQGEEIKDINFIKWYSGMEESKIRNAFKRYKTEK